MAFSLKSNTFGNVLEERVNLLNRPQSSTSFKPSTRYTTTYVIKKGYFNLVRYLLSTGADPNFIDEKEHQLRTSLIYSTFIKDETWSISVAQNLLEFGASLKQSDAKGLTAFHYCCAFGRLKLLELFLKSLDFDLSKALDANGNSCLHYALRSHNKTVVSIIVAKLKKVHMVKVNTRNVYGMRPIDLEDEDELVLLKEANKPHLLFNGLDSLEECKLILSEYIVYLQEKQARRERLLAQQNEANSAADIKKKAKGGKRRKGAKKSVTSSNKTAGTPVRKRSASSRSKASSKASLNSLLLPESIKEESPRIQTNLFFTTELDDKALGLKPPKSKKTTTKQGPNLSSLVSLKIASWRTEDRPDSVVSMARSVSQFMKRDTSTEKTINASTRPQQQATFKSTFLNNRNVHPFLSSFSFSLSIKRNY